MAERDTKEVINRSKRNISDGVFLCEISPLLLGVDGLIVGTGVQEQYPWVLVVTAGLAGLAGVGVLLYCGANQIVNGHAELQAATTAELIRDSLVKDN